MSGLFLGLGGRYSYSASTHLDRIALEAGSEFEWYPVNSIELIGRARSGDSPFDQPRLSGQYAPEFRYQDARRWAAYYGAAYFEPDLSSIEPTALPLTTESRWIPAGPVL